MSDDFGGEEEDISGQVIACLDATDML